MGGPDNDEMRTDDDGRNLISGQNTGAGNSDVFVSQEHSE